MASVGKWRSLRRWAVGLVVAAAACGAGGSRTIVPTTLADQIATGTAPVVLDVRSTREYEAGHVPGAIHIPFQQVASRIDELPTAPDAPIVVYCAHGPRAVWAARALRKAGHTQVLYLEGHMAAWRKAGLPVETPAAVPDDSPRRGGDDDAVGAGSD
ncbi:MAG: rhodanese-like domain-containing protein [Nitrospirota bacterium]|jgi:rhodanese-related sulfurtransferase